MCRQKAVTVAGLKIRLQLATAVHWQGVKLQVAVSQLAPLSIAYHSDSKKSSSSGSSPSEADDTKTPHQGFTLRLGLSTAF